MRRRNSRREKEWADRGTHRFGNPHRAFDIDKKDVGSLVIAYEPIWAIGTGAAATAEDAEAVCAFIRETVKDIAGKKAASDIRILYGGSVKSENIADFLKEKDIDGALIGGASLKPEDFLSIYEKSGK